LPYDIANLSYLRPIVRWTGSALMAKQRPNSGR
jgi:hypothetical protein